MDEATAILRRYAEISDTAGHLLNPEFEAAERPAGLDLDRFKPRGIRFKLQYSLCTLLFFVLVASSAMSWYGIGYRRNAADQAILAQLERFKPNVGGGGDYLSLDFSASPVKPGDADLEVVAKLSRLQSLNLSGRAGDGCRLGPPEEADFSAMDLS